MTSRPWEQIQLLSALPHFPSSTNCLADPQHCPPTLAQTRHVFPRAALLQAVPWGVGREARGVSAVRAQEHLARET